MKSQGNTSKAPSDISKRPNTRSHSRRLNHMRICHPLSEDTSQPNIMSVMVTDVDTSEDKMTELEKKINMLMKVVEEMDYEIASLKNHIECHDVAESRNLLVKQFVRADLKENTFDWYTNMKPESIDSWEQLERDFLNRFYNTRRIVSMMELTNTRQRKGEPIIDYINR
ncbi:ty3-gypsy retrotransposon protein [Cucumis melo var. makuwa]|uniref:Ty3-gypsy retrotransposon protein n=1 Tax=Cucumis melo var. makuwa TaxID=1194695 RepID=A0A5D3CA42_CUCMM|nr:ty3-gypsy retrotransposon protein [Cucumis melo var. makuwa]